MASPLWACSARVIRPSKTSDRASLVKACNNVCRKMAATYATVAVRSADAATSKGVVW